MIYVLYGVGLLGGWLLIGYLWCTLFVDDEDEEDNHQECPYD